MKGGATKGTRFMKAGKADNIGIIDNNKNKNKNNGNDDNYYSDSSSAIEGLCE
jgi:hypothetical protein